MLEKILNGLVIRPLCRGERRLTHIELKILYEIL